MRRGLSGIVFAAVGLAVACSSFDGDDPPTPSSDAGTDATPDPGSNDAGDAAPAQSDATVATPFCDLANATACTDFEDTTDPSRQWAKVLDGPEPKGSGSPPYVDTSADEDRGKVYISRFRGGVVSPDFSLSRRAHHDMAPKHWLSGIPSRVFEAKVYIAKSSAKDSAVAILGWNGDDGTAHSLFVSCPNASPKCSVSVGRVGVLLATRSVTIAKATWTKVTVSIGPTTYDDTGMDDPNAVAVETQVAGQIPEGDTVVFPIVVKAPHKLRVDVGLALNSPTSEEWEVHYDDVALTY